MERIPVSSSNVVSVGYDEPSLTLEVEYRAGVYQYTGVPPETYSDLMNAGSIGAFMNDVIKPNFPYTQV